ncbi:WbuC family cupin fold metalloprotein [Yersinia ruckeri]|uniref:WbuC family cupin fold metalloprotein n=1 Tax=Yersinia ruckeri TaxID=29486 RepID=UPI00223850FF|nr:WbuC family cupin fold metalloprotein [Yersinia ruckeri]MCW6569286.1 WbuC family cupin fold metalloprotein [Yersinia ruckeri]
MRLIDNMVLEELFVQAISADRKRAHLRLHTSHQEKVQRLLIAMVEGSYVEPHFHELPHQWEMFIVLQGEVEVCLHDEAGKVRQEQHFGPAHEAMIVELAPGDIHSVTCISERALLLEVKEGPFDPSFAKAFIQ